MRSALTTITKATWAAIISMAASVAWGDGISTSFSGYGTVGGTFTSDGKSEYYHNPTEFTGASNSFDVGLESRIGVQAVVSFDSQWSVTAQEVAKLRGSTNFDPGTEWLYAQYQPDSDLKLRMGRVVLPVFLVSDTINVGYAVPWFRAPNDIYATEPFEYLDGGQALWQHSLGAFQLNLEATYGETAGTFYLAGFMVAAKSKSTFNAAVSLSWRNLLARYAETDLKTTASVPVSATLTQDLNIHDHFHCVGLQYDDGKALLMSEWTKRDENNLLGFTEPLSQETTWYAAGGWRLGKFTPLVMYSVVNTGATVLASVGGTHHAWDASLRYDVLRNLDLKLQISRAQADSAAYFIVPNNSGGSVNVYSFGADFVF